MKENATEGSGRRRSRVQETGDVDGALSAADQIVDNLIVVGSGVQRNTAAGTDTRAAILGDLVMVDQQVVVYCVHNFDIVDERMS